MTQKRKLSWKRILAIIVITAIAVPSYYGFYFIITLLVGAMTGSFVFGMFIGLLPLLILIVFVAIAELSKRRKKEKVEQKEVK